MTSFRDIFHTHVCEIAEGQQLLSDRTGEGPWHIDLAELSGQLTVSGHRFNIQLIGTEDTVANSWMWAWANAQTPPAALLAASQVIHANRAMLEIPELMQSTIPLCGLDGMNANTLSAAFVGATQLKAYFRCPYEGGALYVGICDPTLVSSSAPLIRAATVIPMTLRTYKVADHQLAITRYAEDHLGLTVYTDLDSMQLADPRSGEVLDLTFDGLGRLRMVEGASAL